MIEVKTVCGELFIPQVFSPNNDGENDVLFVFGGCIENMLFAIYDRWGEKVFETTNPSQGWNGVYKNKLMNNAVFTYYLTATFNGQDVIKKGNISIIQ
jgi:gliding motility-associated-like protein